VGTNVAPDRMSCEPRRARVVVSLVPFPKTDRSERPFGIIGLCWMYERLTIWPSPPRSLLIDHQSYSRARGFLLRTATAVQQCQLFDHGSLRTST